MNSYFNSILDRIKNPLNDSVYFSIIIPVHNTEKYLRRCLDSILSQSFRDIEIIVVNDFSPNTDECDLIISSYNDTRIKYIKNEVNMGSLWSRVNGLSYASGKYVHFVDSDDWLFDNAYNNIFKYLKNRFDCLYFNGIYADDDKTWEYDGRFSDDSVYYGKRVAFDKMFFDDGQNRTLWCRVFKRSIALSAVSYLPKAKTSIADDWIFNLLILFFAKNYRSVSDIFYYYYQDNPEAVTAIIENKKNNNISFQKFDNKVMQMYISYNALIEFLKTMRVFDIYKYSWLFYIIRDIEYAFLVPFKNFDTYFYNLYNTDKELYINESFKYFNSNLSNLSILSFLSNNLNEASGFWERRFIYIFLRHYTYRFFSSIIRVRNYPQALFKINVTKTTEYKRLYIRFLFFKFTIKLGRKE